MARGLFYRLSAFVVITFIGTFVNWSSIPFDLDRWRADQAARALEEASEEAPGDTQSPDIPVGTSPPSPLPTPPGTSTPPVADNGSFLVDCDAASEGNQASCSYEVGDEFSAAFSVGSAPLLGYTAFELFIELGDGVAYQPADSPAEEALWPDCTYPARSQPSPNAVAFGCVPFPPLAEDSAYTGPLIRLAFECTGNSTTQITLAAPSENLTGSYFLSSEQDLLAPSLSSANITCGSGSPPTPTATPTEVLTPAPTESPTTPSTDVDYPAEPGTVIERDIAVEGGTIASPDGRVTINFPDEAVAEPLRVRITNVDVTTLPPNPEHPLLTAWEFEAFAVERDMVEVEEFPADISITANYTDHDLEGRNVSTLRLWTWNEELEQWDPLPGESKPGESSVTATSNHFSIDAGTADPAVASPAFLRSFQTDLQSGAAELSIPIEVPSGRGGLVPTINLNYSSNRVNEMKNHYAQGSWAGVGWDLDAGGSIRKVFPSYLDPNAPARYFLELNGRANELIKVGSTWRTKQHEYLDIQLISSNGDCSVMTTPGQLNDPAPPCHWVVRDKRGTSYYFGGTGETTGTADEGSARYYASYTNGSYKLYHYRWDLKKVKDTHNNTIDYTYWQQEINDWPTTGVPLQEYDMSAYLSTITYNGGSTSITFNRAHHSTSNNWPNNTGVEVRSDTRTYQSFCSQPPKVAETHYLDDIRIAVNGGTVRRYDLAYTTIPATTCRAGHHLLTSMTQLDNTSGTADANKLFTRTFDYTTATLPVILYSRANGQTTTTQYDRFFLQNLGNGFGGTQSVVYQERHETLTVDGQKTWGRQIVTTETQSPGLGGSDNIVRSFFYTGDPKYDIPPGMSGEFGEYRGFTSVQETRDNDGTYGTFVQHDYFTTGGFEGFLSGREKQTRTYDWQNRQWRKVEYSWNWECFPTCGGFGIGPANFVFLEQVTTTDGYNGSSISRVFYEYDDYGNLFCERQQGLTTTTTDDRTIYRPHTHATGPWIFTPQRELVYAGDHEACLGSNVLRGTNFYYDKNEPITKGELTGIEYSDGQVVPAVYSDVYMRYDTYGNKQIESVPTTVRVAAQPPGHAIPSGIPTTTWTYDSLQTYPVTITNPAGHVTTHAWDTVMGTLLSIEDPNGAPGQPGHITRHVYDSFGRIDRTYDDSFTNSTSPSVQYLYYWKRHETSSYPNATVIVRRGATLGVGDATWESHCLDRLGRDIMVKKSYKPNEQSVVQTTYNRRGLAKLVTKPFTYNPTSEPGYNALTPWLCNAWPDPSSRAQTQFSYNPLDEASKTTTIANGLTTFTTFNHNGQTRTSTDEASHAVTHSYDAFGRLTTVQDDSGVVSYTYDALDNMTLIVDQLGNTTEMQYDALGRKIVSFDPDLGKWTYVYDVAGNVRTQTDARGQIIQMVYDSIDRLTRKCYGVSQTTCVAGTSGVATNYTYDTYGSNPLSCPNPYTAVGHMTRIEDVQAPIRNTYRCFDLRGRRTKERLAIDSESPTTVTTFDLADRVSQLTYPDNEVVTYSYDVSSGQPLTMVTSLGGSYVTTTSYDASMRIDIVQRGNGKNTDFDFDGRDRITKIATQGPSSDVQNLQYTYHPDGNVASLNDLGQTASFGYDALHRLKTVSGGAYTANYEYDAIGNLRQVHEGSNNWWISYDPRRRPHAALIVDSSPIPSVDSIARAYAYDANGNLLGTATGQQAEDIDSDDDGCANKNERGLIAGSGQCGLRDPANFWDYFNPTRDCTNRVDDISAVIARYGPGTSNKPWQHDPVYGAVPPAPAYHTRFDRGDIQGMWAGPPNGVITVADIVEVVNKQYFHDNPGGCPAAMTPQYEYDEENRLKARNDGGGQVTYTYDGEGRLVKKLVAPSTATYYVADGIYEKQGSIVTKYYFFNGQRIAVRKSGALNYLLTDHLGSVTHVVNSTDGSLVSSQSYFPFGQLRSTTGGGVGGTTDKQYTGHQIEGSLYFMKARFQDPQAGRFLQPDTAGFDPMNTQSLNRFSYVMNNPLRLIDPSGNYTEDYATRLADAEARGCTIAVEMGIAYVVQCPQPSASTATPTSTVPPSHQCPWNQFDCPTPTVTPTVQPGPPTRRNIEIFLDRVNKEVDFEQASQCVETYTSVVFESVSLKALYQITRYTPPWWAERANDAADALDVYRECIVKQLDDSR